MKQSTKDLLGLVVPALQLLMLGILTALITFNIDKFKAGIDESVMINELVKDLSKDSIKSNIKSDFVLLSLERYLKRSHNGDLKDYDKEMLVGFAKSIIINQLSSSDTRGDQKTNNMRIPKEILHRYDSTNYNSFISTVYDEILKETKIDTIELKNMSSATPVRQMINPQKSTLLNILIPKSVYFQYNDPDKVLSVDSIRLVFQNKKWNAPSLELVKTDFENSIRYFHTEDYKLVEETVKTLNDCKLKDFKVIHLTKYQNVPKGQIEIWINYKPNYHAAK